MDLLQITLSASIPLYILQIKEKGEITEKDMERAREFSQVLGEKGDVLLFGSKKKGETAKLFNDLAWSIALLSFCPGGITIFKQHYENKLEDNINGKTNK